MVRLLMRSSSRPDLTDRRRTNYSSLGHFSRISDVYSCLRCSWRDTILREGGGGCVLLGLFVRLLLLLSTFFLPSFLGFYLLVDLSSFFYFRPRNLFRLFACLPYFCVFLFMPPKFLICYINNLSPSPHPLSTSL